MRLDDAGPRTWLLAACAGWALLAWLLALAGMGGRVQPLADDPGQLPPLPQPRPPSAATEIGPLSRYDQFAARPLFTQDRRPKPFVLQGQGDGEAQAADFDYVLTSVLITPGLRMAILQPPDGGDSVRVKLGEAPGSLPAWRLVELDRRGAVFEGPEGRRELNLRVFDGKGGQPPTPSGLAGRPAPVGVPVAPPQPAPVPAPPPGAEPTPQQTEQAQMEAIRRRIEARRAQLRQQQSQQSPQPPQNSPPVQ
ncbi:general secretion pathway protein N [Vulcaniibacterium tengchongense]|uniref:General secretion pathway protein N n=2 Tax=Vulcaniibacterium tengchongense TaxID=1273429 RepID=A0A3N4VDJ9_9GAMM|nr:general secretion pathway protein GspN [Vulcaniibacterium tengchongense]RPE79555.1 general secretion pathway protein N [Vulcaniibacterium tengchongense]